MSKQAATTIEDGRARPATRTAHRGGFRRPRSLRVVTYNIHKCRGLDRRVRPDRIARILGSLDADVIALQEVVSVEGAAPEMDQAKYLAHALGLHVEMGEARKHGGGRYGNVLLTRLEVASNHVYDVSCRGCEPRICQRVDLRLHGQLLHVFNLHLGTSFLERRQQARLLLSARVIRNEELRAPRIVVGDFNEWTRGHVTRLLGDELRSADLKLHMARSRTYPGLLPFLHLDHVYYDPELELEKLTLLRNRATLLASDHLPLIADFRY